MSGAPQAGLNELQLPRYLLDTCTTATQAEDALYGVKVFNQYAVAHYLIADRDTAFVWEREAHNVEHVVHSAGDALCVTNYLLHRRGRPDDVPDDTADPASSDMYRRARALWREVHDRSLSASDLWSVLETVRADARAGPPEGPTNVRTLWHSQYEPDAREVTFEFYLGDEPDGSPRRSEPVTLALNVDSRTEPRPRS